MRAVLLASVMLVAACAPTGPMRNADDGDRPMRSPRQCFDPARIINFSGGGQGGLNIKVLGGDVYRLNTGGCTGYDGATALTITPTIPIPDRLCVGDMARVTSSSATAFGPCLARVESQLTPAQIEALPSRERP